MNMGKKFSKTVTKRTKVRLSPRDAEDIIKQEFTDDRGNKFIFRMTGSPHKHNKPTIEGTVEYNDGNNNN